MKILNHKIKIINQSYYLWLCLLPITFTACRKYITVDSPATSMGTVAAFETNTSAAQVLTGLYSGMAGSVAHGSLVSSCILPELSADNLTLHDPDASPMYVDYYRNMLEPNYFTSNQQDTYWMKLYEMMFTINTAIEQLTGNDKLSPNVAKRLLGEAHFMRAFSYFYLINFYGEVPLILTTNYKQNSILKKNTSAEVYNQILNDLSIAEGLLDYYYFNGDISGNTTNRLRPNLAAVQALQSRVYLYQKNYVEAESAATKVLTQPGYELSSLETAFLKNSAETIWGLQPVEVSINTRLGLFFLIPDATGPNNDSYPVYASTSLLNSFEEGDARKTKWLGPGTSSGEDYYYIKKYNRAFIPESKVIDEYTIVLRVAELYLIRAEARNEQGNSAGAVEDLNAIRQRSRSTDGTITNPLPALETTLTSLQLRPIILRERRVELFAEWGHRWFDLRRSGTIDEVMDEEEETKGGSWASHEIYYPIPRDEIKVNTAITQTPGYTN
jgi:starch-binding outer membrane protein, SusD/RagB family